MGVDFDSTGGRKLRGGNSSFLCCLMMIGQVATQSIYRYINWLRKKSSSPISGTESYNCLTAKDSILKSSVDKA